VPDRIAPALPAEAPQQERRRSPGPFEGNGLVIEVHHTSLSMTAAFSAA
jgi:hypothetical protein